jgi:hypothetical protein
VTLGERQRVFTRLVAKLIEHAYVAGYGLTFGEAYRTPEQAALNAKAGKGIANSLHGMRLAIDLNLFRDGAYLANTEDHRPLGEYWKTLHPDCCLGGDFSKPDGNHYSMTYGGIK